MLRLVPSIVAFIPLLLLAACTDEPRPTAPGDPRRDELEAPAANGRLGDPLPGLSNIEMHMFRRGKYLFQVQFTKQEGLGPTFNARSCAACHDDDDGTDSVFGGAGDGLETHFTRLNADASCSTLAIHGGFVRQDSVTSLLQPYFTTEPLPSGQHQLAQRTTTDLFGLGLIAAIPDAAILARADPNDANGDGISGRAHMVGGVVGRFGRKAAGTGLDGFNAGALLNEMGITNPLFTQENRVGSWVIGGDSIPASVDPVPDSIFEMNSAGLDTLNAFVRFLAPPPSTVPNTTAELWGEALFDSIGCTSCHTPEVYTTVSSIPSLNGRTVRPFSDFLLHDMGPQLGDICLGNAGPTEFRTEPLMGARHMRVYLHDGRATTLNQAIYQHGGEAAAARDAYSGLSADQHDAVIAYIRTL
ncbi:MAG TPA: di-heme oxidoredictase family protein [Longimicrobium sp.]|nr:di-heme oxidoredictase family protein [Longimicrobium sp.]